MQYLLTDMDLWIKEIAACVDVFQAYLTHINFMGGKKYGDMLVLLAKQFYLCMYDPEEQGEEIFFFICRILG